MDISVVSMIQFICSEHGEKPRDRVERNYRALLAVAVVLNSQRDMYSLWEAITAEITKINPWAWASVTLYDREADGFRFYVIATTIGQVVLQPNAIVPRVGSAMG